MPPRLVGRARYMELSESRWRLYRYTAAGLLVWAATILIVAVKIFPTGIYWLVYYIANYNYGFVRRGLGGEIIAMFPAGDYFTVAYILMWLPVAVWTATLGWLMWLILCRSGVRSERKLMLALLIPVLPFSFSYAVTAPRPELVAMAALVAFSASLTRSPTARRRNAQVFSIVVTVLAFVHEAIPLELLLGTLLAVNILAADADKNERRLLSAWATLPGLVATLIVVVFGKRNLGSRLCEQIPHGMIENPYAAYASPQQTLNYMLGRQPSVSDYHDWACRFITYHYDLGFVDGLREVAHLGAGPLLASTIAGIVLFVGTVWVIGFFSGVPSSACFQAFNGQRAQFLVGLVAMIPLFLSASDWLRWWVIITFNVAIVWIMYVRGRRELAVPPNGKTRRAFVCTVIVLALLPVGPNAHVGGRGFHINALRHSVETFELPSPIAITNYDS